MQALAQRSAMGIDQREAACAEAARHFFANIALRPTEIVAAYWPIRDEVDCRPVLTRLMDGEQPVCLPVVKGGEGVLSMHVWEPGTPLYPSGFGTLAPLETTPQVEPDLVLVPLLGFDAKGTRLGYGKGYYDRTLARLSKRPRLIGFGFSAQELGLIPRAAHDVPLDGVVTESGFRRFSQEASQK